MRNMLRSLRIRVLIYYTYSYVDKRMTDVTVFAP